MCLADVMCRRMCRDDSTRHVCNRNISFTKRPDANHILPVAPKINPPPPQLSWPPSSQVRGGRAERVCSAERWMLRLHRVRRSVIWKLISKGLHVSKEFALCICSVALVGLLVMRAMYTPNRHRQYSYTCICLFVLVGVFVMRCNVHT